MKPSGRFGRALDHLWWKRGWGAYALWPLSLVYCGAVSMRGAAYRTGLLRRYEFDFPVIVVGNLTVGGSGKTPLVAAIVRYLGERGRQPGIASRGYGGAARSWPLLVRADTPAQQAGDEPVILARACSAPVMIDPDRVRAVTALRAMGCDCVVCDDGLQHLRLKPRVSIAVVDGERRFGNGFCLPAGPLREPGARLGSVDLVVCNGGAAPAGEWRMDLAAGAVTSVADRSRRCDWEALAQRTVHAVAGIGNPRRFFATLERHGLKVAAHPFPDHAVYEPADFGGLDGPILMTEKDAVKCESFARDDLWFVPVHAEVEAAFFERLWQLMEESTK